jgi:hypothetical protein
LDTLLRYAEAAAAQEIGQIAVLAAPIRTVIRNGAGPILKNKMLVDSATSTPKSDVPAYRELALAALKPWTQPR